MIDIEYIPRWLFAPLKDYLAFMRIVHVCGCRQCGKSTLAHKIVPKEEDFFTLDSITTKEAAHNDPGVFLSRRNGTMIIDEIQKVPDLIPAMKIIVDKNNRPGQFLITGSSDVFSLPSVTESLAGRIAHVRLRTLSEGEIRHSKPTFFEQVKSNNFTPVPAGFGKQMISNIALRGGYPEVINLMPNQRKMWHKNYLQNLLEGDLADIANIRRTDVLEKFVETLYAYSSKYFNTSTLASVLSINRSTFASYQQYFESMYLFDALPPWGRTDYQRQTKQYKIYATDTGLMASVLRWVTSDILNDADRLGKLVETYVYNELAIQCELNNVSMFQYRDKDKREIDFVLEDASKTIAIEVKASEAIRSKDFSTIQWFRNRFCKKKDSVGIILYCGKDPLSFGEGLWALPISSLW